MRYTGMITKWQDERGFGFITPEGGGESVFIHISAIPRGQPRPVGGERVTYTVAADEKGRPRAQQVKYHAAFAAERPSDAAPATGGMVAVIVTGSFFLFLGAAVLTRHLPPVVLIVYLVLSLITFLVYGHDKSAAREKQWRTAEKDLHLLDLLGGWPGGLLAQRFLRHKTSKEQFQVVFWMAVVLNCGALGWLFTGERSEFLRTLIDAVMTAIVK